MTYQNKYGLQMGVVSVSKYISVTETESLWRSRVRDLNTDLGVARFQRDEARRERDAAFAQLDQARDRIKELDAELNAVREEVQADPAVKTLDAVAALRASAQYTIAERNDHIEDLEDTIRHLTSSRDDLIATANKSRREEVESCIRVCEEIERTFVETHPIADNDHGYVAGLCAERLKDLLKG